MCTTPSMHLMYLCATDKQSRAAARQFTQPHSADVVLFTRRCQCPIDTAQQIQSHFYFTSSCSKANLEAIWPWFVGLQLV